MGHDNREVVISQEDALELYEVLYELRHSVYKRESIFMTRIKTVAEERADKLLARLKFDADRPSSVEAKKIDGQAE